MFDSKLWYTMISVYIAGIVIAAIIGWELLCWAFRALFG